MAEPNGHKPTIEERLEAVTQTLELVSRDIEAAREEQRRIDVRERSARAAILAGIAAYISALAVNDGPEEAG